MFYAGIATAVLSLFFNKLLKCQSRPKLIRVFAFTAYIAIVSLAVFNAYSPVVHRLTVTTDKPLHEPMSIALVSDTHWGRWFGNHQIDKLVALVDTQNPDVVVIAGDIMHDTTIAYDNTNMHEHLSKLKAPLGIYATLGNHDYRGYDEAIAEAVEAAGIKALDNESVLLDDSVWLVGRSDDVDQTRLSAKELMTQVDTNKPVVFLEHRPSMMDEIKALPVDLHLSGHTHGGQIFPLTILMNWFSPLNYGTKRLNDTQFLVTSGYGIGAVPFRLSTRSEIWMITLTGNADK
ncbi:metallophosphoesterase [Psychrobacter sp.]